jgi:hypothetical protein
MYSLSGITIPSSQVYSEDYPTRNQENFAAFLLDCAAAQKAADPIIYTDTDFYLASYNFDADTMTSFVSASNALSAEIEAPGGVIGDLLDIAATLIPAQYRFLYYLAKPFLNALAERFFHTLTDEGEDLSEVVEKLEAIDSRLKFTVGESTVGLAQTIFQASHDPIYLEPFLARLPEIRDFLKTTIVEEDFGIATIMENFKNALTEILMITLFTPDPELEPIPPKILEAIQDLKFNDIEADFGFIRALLFSRALMT